MKMKKIVAGLLCGCLINTSTAFCQTSLDLEEPGSEQQQQRRVPKIMFENMPVNPTLNPGVVMTEQYMDSQGQIVVQDVMVDENGYATLAGSKYNVGGKSLSQIKATVRDTLNKPYELNVRPMYQAVRVLGAVGRPGLYPPDRLSGILANCGDIVPGSNYRINIHDAITGKTESYNRYDLIEGRDPWVGADSTVDAEKTGMAHISESKAIDVVIKFVNIANLIMLTLIYSEQKKK